MAGDPAVRELVARLARPNRSGGHVVERATILAEGDRATDVLAWIVDHGGEPEAPPAPRDAGSGVHGDRFHDRGAAVQAAPRRYVLPPGALG